MSSRNCIKKRPSCSKIAKATNIISYQLSVIGRQETGDRRRETILFILPTPHTPHPTP
ncbi:hypothetical protein O53_4185 [Microcystis aeruginosa TAIHU98]|uniref:Uncharacterized protein n=1 Tax=Microcystis aeruginosa TAIHU98 TaxID=1134457 RepID=L7E8J0_MICAE|nr:hypothetical protein O53_4185 [Microcystis aeruginosa TAIHU98]ODV37591.1 hypothetical protein BFG60_2921 [Microcystis aeruginosa NIES-98]